LPYCSDFGFLIGISENGFIVQKIEIGGLADKSGVNIKDKIVSIDHGDFDLNNGKQLDSYLFDKNSVTLTIERDRKNIDITIER
jgi:C-terminal processing protease CtpA/Prc